MEIKFIKHHVIRGENRDQDFAYEKDQVVDFSGPVEETYARAFIERGYAIAYGAAARAIDEKAKADRMRTERREWLSKIFHQRG